jgi:pyridoxal phosphate enzyme (YggS family)
MRPSRDVVLANLAVVREGIERAAERSGRSGADVTLVAAGKSVAVEPLRWVASAGVSAIGENYVQELRDVRPALADLPITWHYIGTLRSGGASLVADLADVVETVGGERAARKLAGRAARAGRVLDAFLEVDLTGERAGAGPDRVASLADVVAGLDGLRLHGLMTVPPVGTTAEEARPWFRRLAAIRDDLRSSHPEAQALSMGMSLDYSVAIEEGATMVRIGTALFGPRTT